MHMYEMNIKHLFLDIDGDQPNSSWRVLLLSFSSSWAVIYRVALQHNLVHERNGVVFKILLGGPFVCAGTKGPVVDIYMYIM